ncbi:Proteasome subunit alpha type-5 [Thelohanellus kitauei]|uniref:Proteasome subunit alpha type n=1 Tax=Thelohanellus kitauei TaxID=669202 RepID=A0A0C2MP21_THEKT|nr:Proteasome subunit alpha type-5 [Thelohanellus kitauei]
MFFGRNDYDRGINTFSPEGRLIQVEYAIEAIKLGSTAIGLQCSEGIVFAVERRITSKLIVSSSTKKINEVDSHIACAMSGLIADAWTLVQNARVEATNHWFTYNEPIPVESVAQSLSKMTVFFGTDKDSKLLSRPFGVALLIGGIDEDGPKLFHLDPSGTQSVLYKITVGSAAESARCALKTTFNKDASLIDTIKLSIKTLKIVMEDKVNSENIEIGIIGPDKKFRLLTTEEIANLLDEMK